MKTNIVVLAAILNTAMAFGFEMPTVAEWQKREFDFVELKDKRYQITQEEIQAIYPDDPKTEDPGAKLRTLYSSAAGLENLYGRLHAGPIPDGEYKGSVILPREGRYEIFFKVAQLFGFSIQREKIEKAMQRIWRGKTFDKRTMTLQNQILLRNDLAFPAKLYCGISFMDKTEPSVIIDYGYSDDLGAPLYEDLRDKIVTRHGVAIRDEIRMIRPGFYLGRAYMDGVFALNFVLFRANVNEATNECGNVMPENTAGLLRGDI